MAIPARIKRRLGMLGFVERSSIVIFLVAFLGLDYSIANSAGTLVLASSVGMAVSGSAGLRFHRARKGLKRSAEAAYLAERASLVREWQFPLWKDWQLSGRALERAKAGLPVEVLFGSDEVELQHPFRVHAVVYEAGADGPQMVAFPRAEADSDGGVQNYGDAAVLLGAKLGLPEWDFEKRGIEEFFRWQLPSGSKA